MHTVYIGLGSNLGNRKTTIQEALSLLNSHDHIEVMAVSSLQETKAQGSIQQPDFINAAAELSTILSPEELLLVSQDIEKKLGRQVKGNYGPRTIDLDILFYDSDIILSPELTIPHPLVNERLFVLAPLQEIAPDYKHPTLDVSIRKLYFALQGY